MHKRSFSYSSCQDPIAVIWNNRKLTRLWSQNKNELIVKYFSIYYYSCLFVCLFTKLKLYFQIFVIFSERIKSKDKQLICYLTDWKEVVDDVLWSCAVDHQASWESAQSCKDTLTMMSSALIDWLVMLLLRREKYCQDLTTPCVSQMSAVLR